jgi:hypothetical protein
MPNRDKTGPSGKGAGTGRKEGLCTPEEMKDSVNFKIFGGRRRSGKGLGKGLGRGPKDGTGNGRGQGRGMRRGRKD